MTLCKHSDLTLTSGIVFCSARFTEEVDEFRLSTAFTDRAAAEGVSSCALAPVAGGYRLRKMPQPPQRCTYLSIFIYTCKLSYGPIRVITTY